MNVLLTGGRGMLGQAIQRAVARAGMAWNLVAPTSAEVDLRDGVAVAALFQAHSFDLVIHAAAKVGGIQANINSPVTFLADNLLMNTHVIEAARDQGVPRFLFIGSSCMYPKDYRNPLHEYDLLAAPLEPTNEGYAISKLAGAKLCEYISRQERLAYRTVIPCNLFGPGDDFAPEHSHLLAAIIVKLTEAVRDGRDEVEIWGDGEARREFLYIDDLADFIVGRAEQLDALPHYLNLGLGADYTVNEFYQMAARVVGYQGRFVHDTSRPVGMRRKLMDSSAARDLGWAPATGIEEGLARTLATYRQGAQ